MKEIIILLTIFILSVSITCSQDEYWINKIDKEKIVIQHAHGSRFSVDEWLSFGNHNFVNLSFWRWSGPVGKLYIDGKNSGTGYLKWPFFEISPVLQMHSSSIFNHHVPLLGFSGSHLLVKNGLIIKYKNKFARRKCSRVVIGHDKLENIYVLVFKRATLFDASIISKRNGIVNAINVDGGSSTMFVKNGKIMHYSKQNQKVPVILSW